jgi:exonuclease VII large subunit
MSQKVNADRVASVRDVVIAFVKAMEEYVGQSRSGFDDIHSKLNEYKSFLDSKLSTSDSFMLGMAQSTQSELEAVSGMVDALQSRVDSFNNRAKQQLYNLEEERSALQARHEREVTDLKQRLQSANTQIQDDQDSTSQQVDYWLSEEDSDLGLAPKKQPATSLAEIHPHERLMV